MKIKLLLAFALMIGLISAGVIFIPSDTLHFDYVTYSPTIDGTHEYDEGECNSIVNDELTTRYCYYKDDLYFYFFISDDEADAGDYFYLGFDTDRDDLLEKGEPRIMIYRNGSIMNSNNWEYDTFTAGRGGWRGEILVPFVDVGLPITLGPGKSQIGPNIKLLAKGGSEGTLGQFYGTGVGETNSLPYWSQPQSFTVKPVSIIDPSQDWIRETDNATVKVLEFSIATNNEEPFSISQMIFDSTGTGNEQDDIQRVDLYQTTGPTTQLIGSEVFTHDNGVLNFHLLVNVKGTHAGSNAHIFELFYIMDPQAGSVYGSAASFRVDLTAVNGIGSYTTEKLPVNNLPFQSGSLFTYDCATDSGCADSKFCDNKKCTNVIPATACGYAANHIWNDYECCNDTDCSSGYVCSGHSCTDESSAPNVTISDPPLANITAPPAQPGENTTTNESGTPPVIVPYDNTTTPNKTVIAPGPNATAPDTNQSQGDTTPKSSDPWLDDTTLLLAGAAIVIIGAGAIYYYKFKK